MNYFFNNDKDGDKMKKKSSMYIVILALIIFFLISTLTIYSTSKSYGLNNVIKKQVGWYILGFFIIIFMSKFKFKWIDKIIIPLYILFNILLFLLLIFGREINGSKCWFILPGIGSFQPSEFMKLILILMNAKIFNNHNKKYTNGTFKSDLKLFFITMIITLVPSVLTFLEPDTGVVIIYFLISFVMLFVYGIKKSIFIILILVLGILIGLFLYFYFNYQNKFIDIFGTSFFYRIDRLLDWSSKSGMQLNNALAAIKAAGFMGFGIGNTPIYIPEAHTDFIFSVYSSNFGLIGSIILIITIVVFNYGLIRIIINSNDRELKYIVIGFLTMILYQQVQNISMNIGLLPITGITLPFISYGGSSLLSYMLGIGIIINYKRKSTRKSGT